MPTITTRHASGASPQRVWEALAYSASFASYIPEIVAVDVLRQEADRRSSRWTVLLGEARLSWQEEATFDHAARRIDFTQTSGALASLTGHWLVKADGAGSAVELVLTFEAGIPLLDATLHTITEQALREFAEAVLGRIAERAAGTPAAAA